MSLLVATQLRSPFPASGRWRGCRSSWRPAKCMRSSGRTAPASPRSSASSPAPRRADAGSLTMEGAPVLVHMRPADARARGIAAIYQHPALFPDSVGRREHRAPGRRRPSVVARELERRVRSEASALWIGSAPRSTPASRRDAQPAGAADGRDRQSGRRNARILLMDEPTAALTEPEVDRLFDGHR